MSLLIEVPYYCVPREEDERTNQVFKMLFTNVQRWWPQAREQDDAGLSRLRQLSHGESIPAEHLQQALEYCYASLDWYQVAPEPFPGNNDLATADFVAMLAALQGDSDAS